MWMLSKRMDENKKHEKNNEKGRKAGNRGILGF